MLIAGPTYAADPVPARANAPKELLEKRLEAASKDFRQNVACLKGVQALPSEVFGWLERRLDTELVQAQKPTARATAWRDHLERTQEIERVVAALAKAGQVRQAGADAATYYRLEAVIHLAKEGSGQLH
jgi:hypothetical protein